jgi:hypothetical protein
MNFGTKSYLACSIAAVLGTGSANALTPASGAPQFTIYIGGGSAEPQPVQVAVCKLLTNVDSYTDAAGGAESGDYKVLYGSATAQIGTTGTTIPSGATVMVMYKFNGGSYVNGAIPQSNSGSNLTYPTNATSGTSGPLGTAAASTGLAAGSACSTTNNGAPTFSYTAGTTTSNLPDFGITDLEPAAFTGFNIPTTVTAVPSTSITTAHIYDLVEGVAVTQALYAVKTRWTSQEVAQILSGQITDWSLLSGDNGAPLANITGHTGNPVILIDRNVGSGTKAAGTSFFLNYPGLSGAGLAVEPESVSGLSGGATGCTATYTCYSPSASATFSTTFNGYQDIQDSSSAAVVADLGKANAAGQYAIAILSADNAPYANQVSGVNTYDFVKINGEAMDLSSGLDNINGSGTGAFSAYDNVITGAYGFFYQVAFNTRPGYLSGTTANVNFTAAMKTQLSADALAGAFSGSHFPTAAPGLVIDATNDTSSATTGVTIATRNGVSSGPLKLIKYGVTITQADDPL